MTPERANESQPAGSEAAGSGASPSLWPPRLAEAIASASEWVTRPRVRLALTGALLLLISVLLTANSVWTLPLVIVGALMVVVAWIGHRLDGRFAIEWGQNGTQLAFRATVRAARPADTHTPELDLEAAQIIDGEAHTVEIDVAELKALIEAVKTREAEAAPYAPAQDIRIRRMAGDGPRSSDAAG
jgi:hypothetical protein